MIFHVIGSCNTEELLVQKKLLMNNISPTCDTFYSSAIDLKSTFIPPGDFHFEEASFHENIDQLPANTEVMKEITSFTKLQSVQKILHLDNAREENTSDPKQNCENEANRRLI